MILHEVSCKERTTLLVFPVVSKCALLGVNNPSQNMRWVIWPFAAVLKDIRV